MRGVTVLDGGMGKELRRIGAPFRQPEWSSLALMEAPEMVVRAHSNFVEAGAEVITTNNYAVVPYHHDDRFFEARGAELTRLAGELARTAAAEAPSGHRVRVAGSMPPLFGSYEPDRFDPVAAAPMYRIIVEALEPSVDIWLGETLSSVAELHEIVDAIEEVDAARRPVWMGFTFPDQWKDGRTVALRSGEGVDAIAAAAVDRSLDAVLVNCTVPEQTGPALAAIAAGLSERGVTIGHGMALGAYANAFPETERDSYAANTVILERRDDLTPDRYADIVGGWIELGATLVGGCCDMYPEHIAALAGRFGDARRT